MIFNGYCPLIDKQLSEGKHIEIVAELVGLKKHDEARNIKKEYNYNTFDEMLIVCEGCPNFISC